MVPCSTGPTMIVLPGEAIHAAAASSGCLIAAGRVLAYYDAAGCRILPWLVAHWMLCHCTGRSPSSAR
jgi:hypothetical protein